MAGTGEAVHLLEALLDRAMEEVFGTMIGMSCSPWEGSACGEGITVTAMIGLAGALRGSVVLQADVGAALRVSSLMTGMEAGEVDATVRDALGEMANMVAGSWKGYDPELASRCLLSTPTVVVGENYELFSRKAEIGIERGYRFGEFVCLVTVSCERV
jgi:chemotaxis protein CheX